MVESQGFMMCSEVQRQGKNLNRRPKTLEADLVLHWGQRKRHRLVKGTSEKPANKLDKVTSVSEKALQCNHSLSVRWQPDVHNIGVARQSCATDTESGFMKGPTEEPTAVVDLTQRGNSAVGSLAQIVSNAVSDLERHFFPQKQRENGIGSFAGGRDAKNVNNHRRTEVESLQGAPTTFGLFRWPKVLISLSWKEKEDDFMAIKGSKLPQRPKRHPKKVEKTLQVSLSSQSLPRFVCPWFWTF
eukprot:c27466_g1_i1 orf=312-1040(+)